MSVSTQIKVISMTSAHQRREQFAAGAANATARWEFFDALRLPAEGLHYDEALTVRRFGRALKPGEVGCYASHYEVWRQFLMSAADQLLVFEDDVMVDWPLIEQLCTHRLGDHGIDVLRLYTSHPINVRIAKYKLLSDHSHLMRVRGYLYGTQAYVLSRRGAEALLSVCQVMTMPVDWAMSRYWACGMPAFTLFPFPVLERHGPSTIEHAQQIGASPLAAHRADRFLWRLRDRAARAWFDLTSFPASPLGSTADVGGPYLGPSGT